MARQVQTQIGRARARVPGFAVALAENPKEWGKWKEYRALIRLLRAAWGASCAAKCEQLRRCLRRHGGGTQARGSTRTQLYTRCW